MKLTAFRVELAFGLTEAKDFQAGVLQTMYTAE
jgi:hypothetical protein